MEELKLGFVTNAELASWFGTSTSNLSHKKKNFLKKLSDYCEFQNCRGGITITKIIQSFYVKNQNYKIVEDNYDKYWSSSGLDTCAHVGGKIYADYYDKITVQESTTIKHTAQVRNAKFNKPFSEEPGPCGKCTYLLCKKNEQGQLVWLSAEEETIKQQLFTKYFGSAEEKTILVNMMVENGEITTEEAWDKYSSLMKLPKNYSNFMYEFKQLTGVQLIKGTLVERIESAFEEKHW